MFWENYLALCNSVGKSPNAVASEIGIKSSGTVTGWSNGAIPRKSVLFRLSQYFEVTEEDLLSENILMDPVPPEQSTRGMTLEERTAYYQKNTPAETGRRIPYEEKREILAADGIRLHLDADVKLTDEQLEDIVDFIQFQQRKNEK